MRGACEAVLVPRDDGWLGGSWVESEQNNGDHGMYQHKLSFGVPSCLHGSGAVRYHENFEELMCDNLAARHVVLIQTLNSVTSVQTFGLRGSAKCSGSGGLGWWS